VHDPNLWNKTGFKESPYTKPLKVLKSEVKLLMRIEQIDFFLM
jgi:hypothetical protein